jgi:RNA polymerase sigma-70 factor (ECF subfamily)
MAEIEALTEQFESERTRLRAIAYRMLGSLGDADDALQETWLRLSRASRDAQIANLPAWLTTVLTRVCLNLLQGRRTRREEPFPESGSWPAISLATTLDPEHEAVLADSVGVALQVVLETLSPPERVAFVLHDLFSVPFDDIAGMMGRTAVSVRQLASRARRRVAGRPVPDTDLSRQWDVVAAFFAAARDGDFERLLEVLDPDIVLRIDEGPASAAPWLVRGARAVARGASVGARAGGQPRLALVNGSAGAVVFRDGQVAAAMSFTVVLGRIVEIEMLSDPDRLRALLRRR